MAQVLGTGESCWCSRKIIEKNQGTVINRAAFSIVRGRKERDAGNVGHSWPFLCGHYIGSVLVWWLAHECFLAHDMSTLTCEPFYMAQVLLTCVSVLQENNRKNQGSAQPSMLVFGLVQSTDHGDWRSVLGAMHGQVLCSFFFGIVLTQGIFEVSQGRLDPHPVIYPWFSWFL